MPNMFSVCKQKENLQIEEEKTIVVMLIDIVVFDLFNMFINVIIYSTKNISDNLYIVYTNIYNE